MGNVSMLVVCVAVIFSLVSVSQTAPVSQTCEELLKPLEMKTTDPLKGKWSVVATSNNQPGAKTLNTVLITNIWWDIVPGTQDNMVDAIIYTKMYGECSSKIFNISAENNNLSWIYIVPSTAVFLPTCADCLLIQTTTTINGNTYTSLDLASKRRVLNDAELVQFTTQLDCLNMPSKVVFNPKMGLWTFELTLCKCWCSNGQSALEFNMGAYKGLCPEISGPTPDPEELYRALVNFMEMDVTKAIMSTTDRLISLLLG